MVSSRWAATDIPSQSGKVAIVTGANSGLGLETARELARAGALVVIASRDTGKAAAAAAAIRDGVPGALLEVTPLNLAALDSIGACAEEVTKAHGRIDIVVNNAGLMAPPRGKTADGFETQIGTNHLGHFALTGLLLGALRQSEEPRVVTVSSSAHRTGRINFDDLQSTAGYNNWMAYGQSKLANLLFAFELDRRARAARLSLRSVAAHPGYSATNLQVQGGGNAFERAGMAVLNKVVAQSAAMGALPQLYAAVADIPGGSFVGPDGLMEARGHPKLVHANASAYDEAVAKRLWQVSEELTGVRYSLD